MLQRGPLSPLLFNLYVNDLIELIDSATKSPVTITGVNVNSLMYADYLVVHAHSEADLQENMNILSNHCNDWRLEINTKKNTMHGFQQLAV